MGGLGGNGGNLRKISDFEQLSTIDFFFFGATIRLTKVWPWPVLHASADNRRSAYLLGRAMLTQPRTSEITLVAAAIPAYTIENRRHMVGLAIVRDLLDCGRVAQVIRRQRDGAIRRIYLTATPGQIASPSHRTPSVVRVLPLTYTHRASLLAGY